MLLAPAVKAGNLLTTEYQDATPGKWTCTCTIIF